jgi:hypothetical protein
LGGHECEQLFFGCVVVFGHADYVVGMFIFYKSCICRVPAKTENGAHYNVFIDYIDTILVLPTMQRPTYLHAAAVVSSRRHTDISTHG